MRDVQRLVAGDSLSFTTAVADYPASDGWTLKYRLVPRFTSPAQAPITITASTYETTGYEVEIAAGTTSSWAPGVYGWAAWVEKSGERVTIDNGREITVDPNPATAVQGADARSDAVIALENVRAVIQGVASKNVLSYQINDRQLQHYPIPDLIALESKLARDVKREQNAEGMAQGLKSRRQILVRCANA